MKHHARAIVLNNNRDVGLPRPIGGVIKRGMDVAGALCGLVILAPLLVLISLLVRFSNGGGPVFYGHRRIGCGGRSFACYKFRTMAVDGDTLLKAHLQANPAARIEWEATRKLKDDPRVTPVGVVLRKLSLDELPQLYNILVGDMSIVGPRPVVKDELKIYGTSASYYLRSRPGLTGLWQVSGRNDVSYERRVAFDRHYVENWSVMRDMVIIVRTVPAVCLSRGSY